MEEGVPLPQPQASFPLMTKGCQMPQPWPAGNTSYLAHIILISLSGILRPREVSGLGNGALGLEPGSFDSPRPPKYQEMQGDDPGSPKRLAQRAGER